MLNIFHKKRGQKAKPVRMALGAILIQEKLKCTDREATADTEFGAKVAISFVDGYAYVEKLSRDAFNEGKILIESVECYRKRYGYYPEAVQADKIYRNAENLRYCEQHGIRLSGPRLGRPPANKEIQKEQKRLERQDASERNAVEGKFGEGKRRYGLARIMAHLKE